MKQSIGILFLTGSIFLSAHAASSNRPHNVDNVTIGTYYQGGVVYWLDPDQSYRHGLIADIQDAPKTSGYAWDTTPPTKTEAIDVKPFTGKTNTKIIIGALGTERAEAANACASSTNQGYSDWYLPAKKELILMLGDASTKTQIIKTAKEHGGSHFSNSPYWSSSEYYVNSAWNISSMPTGGYGENTYKKNILLSVRCIRAF